MAKLLFYGDDSVTKYKSVELQEIATWLKAQDIIALDTETNVVKSILERELKVISMADVEGDTAVVIEWEQLSHSIQNSLLEGIKTKTCIIQNASFDYQVFKKYGCVLEKIEDTMLAEKELCNGYSRDEGFTGLQELYQRRLDIDISKAEQLTFGDGGPYSDEQITYAAIDVLHLGKVWKQQMQEMKNRDKQIRQRGNKGVRKSYWWQKEFIKAAADMEMEGVRIDREKWYAIADTVKPIYDKELAKLNELVVAEFKDYLYANGHMYKEDTFDGNVWSSSKKKLAILSQMFPGIEKTSQAELKKYLRDNDPSFPDELMNSLNGKKWLAHDYPTDLRDKFAVIKLLLRIKEPNVEDSLNQFLTDSFRDYLIEQGWLIPANTLQFNWASQQQRLALFQQINPEIEKTGKEYIEEIGVNHPIITHYLAWGEVEYQLKMFGKKFYDEHVDLDGKHRTRYNISLKTGRLSSTSPNLLNIPREKVYREAIIPDDHKVFVGADYDGEELVIMATLSHNTVWLDALRDGKDLHSINAELMYGDEWLLAAENDCAYYAKDEQGRPQQLKCKCPKHDTMRTHAKTVTFASSYGASKFRISSLLHISLDEAQALIHRFFAINEPLANFMMKVGNYAVANGHIIEPVFGRIRYYDKWKLAVGEEHGSIRRTSGNYGIQSSGSAILKVACVLIRRHLIQNNLEEAIQMIMPYHDELLLQCHEDYVTHAKTILAKYMQLAAKLAGFAIGAEAEEGVSWSDVH